MMIGITCINQNRLGHAHVTNNCNTTGVSHYTQTDGVATQILLGTRIESSK